MPFPFTLPTTSQLSFQSHYSSSTHPSLPSTATSYRSVLRSALKRHKRLPHSSQSGYLPTVLSAINDYLPYLLALDAGLSGRRVANEEIDVILNSEIAVEWRPTLSASQIPSREASRVKGLGLDYEISFIIHTLAIVQTLLAREQLSILYADPLPTPEQRLAAIQNALKNILAVNSLHYFLVHRYYSTDTSSIPTAAVDIHPTIQSALAALALAEATLLFVLKDDPYPSLTIQSRSKTDREWMIKAPDIKPKRAQVIARLSLAASENASKAASSLSSSTNLKINPDITRYADNLHRVSRAKACRFFGIDADLSGETGKGIGWLRAGLHELGLPMNPASSSSLSTKLKSTLQSRSPSSSSSSHNQSWGLDAGKDLESLTLTSLHTKWTKINDTMNIQLIPDPLSLIATMPSGRDIHEAKVWKPVTLGSDELARMRVVPAANDYGDQDEIGRRLGGLEIEGESSDEDDDGDGLREARRMRGGGGAGRSAGSEEGVVGAFPGTRAQYGSSEKGDSSYY